MPASFSVRTTSSAASVPSSVAALAALQVAVAALLAAGAFLLAGDLIVGNDADGKGGEQFRDYTYAVRPPGVHHGPFKSETGCLLLETHYYD